MKVHEIMTGHPRSVAPHTTLIEAAGLMRELDVGALPVCEGDDLTGIVTDRDIVVRGVADGLDTTTARVTDVMSGGVEAVSADDEVENAVRVMEHRQVRRLPVLDRAKKLIGMISLGDVATSSNPAFGGIALRDVSESNEPNARRRRLEHKSETARTASPGMGRSRPAGAGRNSGARGRAKTSRPGSSQATRNRKQSRAGMAGRAKATARSKR